MGVGGRFGGMAIADDCHLPDSGLSGKQGRGVGRVLMMMMMMKLFLGIYDRRPPPPPPPLDSGSELTPWRWWCLMMMKLFFFSQHMAPSLYRSWFGLTPPSPVRV